MLHSLDTSDRPFSLGYPVYITSYSIEYKEEKLLQYIHQKNLGIYLLENQKIIGIYTTVFVNSSH